MARSLREQIKFFFKKEAATATQEAAGEAVDKAKEIAKDASTATKETAVGYIDKAKEVAK